MDLGPNLTDSVYERLWRERTIVLGCLIDEKITSEICADLFFLSAEDPDQDIQLYINSPGGLVTAGMAIYDTMQLIEPDVATYAMGLDRNMENMERHELEQSMEENRRKLRAMLPKAPAGLDRKTRDHVSGMVALRFSSEPDDPEVVGKARPMLDAISDGLYGGRVPEVFTEYWPEQCGRAVEKVDSARFYCLEGEALRCFCTILAADILLGGDGAGSRLDPRRFLGDFYPLDWM